MTYALAWHIITYALTIFTILLIPIYWRNYGIKNFLWISDIGLLFTVVGLWIDSELLISITVVGTLVAEIIWNIDFFMQLCCNIKTVGIANYMFDPAYSRFLRALSLFHVILPILWISYLMQFGYHKQALFYATGMYWIILTVTYLTTRPEENINWVFTPQKYSLPIKPIIWLIFLYIFSLLGVFLPTHYMCMMLFTTK